MIVTSVLEAATINPSLYITVYAKTPSNNSVNLNSKVS